MIVARLIEELESLPPHREVAVVVMGGYDDEGPAMPVDHVVEQAVPVEGESALGLTVTEPMVVLRVEGPT